MDLMQMGSQLLASQLGNGANADSITKALDGLLSDSNGKLDLGSLIGAMQGKDLGAIAAIPDGLLHAANGTLKRRALRLGGPIYDAQSRPLDFARADRAHLSSLATLFELSEVEEEDCQGKGGGRGNGAAL